MNVMLSTIRRQFALVYLDTIVMFSKASLELISDIQAVLTLLRIGVVTHKYKKYRLFTETMSYLGHVIHRRLLEIASRTTDAIGGFKEPADIPNFRSFLGLCHVFQKFVTNFARLVAPLNAKLWKDPPTAFGPLNENELKSVNLLKHVLISPSVTTLSYITGHIKLGTNVCDVQIGCKLLKHQLNSTTKPIGH